MSHGIQLVSFVSRICYYLWNAIGFAELVRHRHAANVECTFLHDGLLSQTFSPPTIKMVETCGTPDRKMPRPSELVLRPRP